MTTQRWVGPFGVLVTFDPPQAPYGYDFSVNVLHVDEDAVCPVCLGWIDPHDIVRRTAYGPVQHELCPLRRLQVTPDERAPHESESWMRVHHVESPER